MFIVLVELLEQDAQEKQSHLLLHQKKQTLEKLKDSFANHFQYYLFQNFLRKEKKIHEHSSTTQENNETLVEEVEVVVVDHIVDDHLMEKAFKENLVREAIKEKLLIVVTKKDLSLREKTKTDDPLLLLHATKNDLVEMSAMNKSLIQKIEDRPHDLAVDKTVRGINDVN